MVARLTGKDAVSAWQLALETGLRQQTARPDFFVGTIFELPSPVRSGRVDMEPSGALGSGAFSRHLSVLAPYSLRDVLGLQLPAILLAPVDAKCAACAKWPGYYGMYRVGLSGRFEGCLHD